MELRFRLTLRDILFRHRIAAGHVLRRICAFRAVVLALCHPTKHILECALDTLKNLLFVFFTVLLGRGFYAGCTHFVVSKQRVFDGGFRHSLGITARSFDDTVGIFKLRLSLFEFGFKGYNLVFHPKVFFGGFLHLFAHLTANVEL